MIAAVVITHNEEKNILRCLESLRFCDEIIVVDAMSSDNTVALANTIASKVVSRPWESYSSQKNFANSIAESEWILSIDADEKVSMELGLEIQAQLSTPGPETAFSVPRKTLYRGKWIKHGGWYPNRLVRLFKKNGGSWTNDELHERWVTEGPLGELQGHLLHYSFENFTDQVDRNNRYSTLGALRLHRQGARFSFTKMLAKPSSKFLETYVLKRGFLDGLMGLFISISASYSVFLKWVKLWELSRHEAG